MEKAYLITEYTNLKQNFDLYDRLYIGDSFCEHNLIFFIENNDFIKNILKLKKKITLTTPLISETNFKKLINFIKIYKNLDGFEVVVNDYGLLYKIINNFPKIKIIWGNFLTGQNKDPYLKIFKDKKIYKNITIDSDYYKKLFKKYKIEDIELYNTFQGFKIQNNFNIHLLYPYTIFSVTRYCTKNLIKNNIDYLQIVKKCSGCPNNGKDYLEMNLNFNNKQIKNYYIGNKQLYKNNKQIKNNKITRIIYNNDLINNK